MAIFNLDWCVCLALAVCMASPSSKLHREWPDSKIIPAMVATTFFLESRVDSRGSQDSKSRQLPALPMFYEKR